MNITKKMTVFMCTYCGENYCSGCDSSEHSCNSCGLLLCDDCVKKCPTCGDICLRCIVTCDNCGDALTCADCMQECETCHNICCPACIEGDHECPEQEREIQYCDDCDEEVEIQECDHCGSCVCETCFDSYHAHEE